METPDRKKYKLSGRRGDLRDGVVAESDAPRPQIPIEIDQKIISTIAAQKSTNATELDEQLSSDPVKMAELISMTDAQKSTNATDMDEKISSNTVKMDGVPVMPPTAAKTLTYSTEMSDRNSTDSVEVGGLSERTNASGSCASPSVKSSSTTESGASNHARPIEIEQISETATRKPSSPSVRSSSWNRTHPVEIEQTSEAATPTEIHTAKPAIPEEGESASERKERASECEEVKEDKEGETKEEEEEGESSGGRNSIFRGLAIINREINHMQLYQVKGRLRSFNLSDRGRLDVLRKRLKSYYRQKRMQEAEERGEVIGLGKSRRAGQDKTLYFDYYLVIDYEATCDCGSTDYRHEIIEFPGILLDSKQRKVVDEFHSYVKPVLNPRLSDFCTQLTGITQSKVNFAPMFPEVLEKFESWMHERSLTPDNCAIVTDGPWDMGRFMYLQCKISGIAYPEWAKKWINIRKQFSNFYNTRRLSLNNMLEKMGMKFSGQPHCGRDDARNIARVTNRLIKDGANIRHNEHINLNSKTDNKVRNITRRTFFGNQHNTNGRRENGEEGVEENGGKEGDGAEEIEVVEEEEEEDVLIEEEVEEEEEEEEEESKFDMNNKTDFPALM